MSAEMVVGYTVPTVEMRSAQVADVNFPKRLVTVIAMPYEQPAETVIRGKVITEIVTRGAFDGIEKRTNKIRVNRDHQVERTVGKIVALHPSRQEGLVAEVKISPTPLGDETLTLVDDQVLDASAGFGLLRRDNGRGPVYQDAEVWDRSRTVRRLNRLRLDHLALVPDPAYEGARVLDVRNGPGRTETPLYDVAVAEATPRLDWFAYEAQKAYFDELDRRYPH